MVSALTRRIEDVGWQRRPFPGHLAVFTREVSDKFVAVVEVDQLIGSIGSGPVVVSLVFGCGYLPATALMPVLTLPPQAALAHEVARAGSDPFVVTVAETEQVTAAADLLAHEVGQRGCRFAEQHASVDALDAALVQRSDTGVARSAELRMVLLAAAGRRRQAHALLREYVTAHAAGLTQDGSLRFARQISRWLAAGTLRVPEVEDTLARMPPEVTAPPRSHRRVDPDRLRARSRVLDQARGRSRVELTVMLAAAYTAAGVTRYRLSTDVSLLEVGRRTGGRVRLVGSLAADVARLLTHPGAPDPDWLACPKLPRHPLPAGNGEWALVQLSPGLEAWFTRVAAHGGDRLTEAVRLSAWLTHDRSDRSADGHLVVHVGDQVVGTLTGSGAARFAPYTSAAELYDELVRAEACLLLPDSTGSAILELELPYNSSPGPETKPHAAATPNHPNISD